jgi:hypothetical protein
VFGLLRAGAIPCAPGSLAVPPYYPRARESGPLVPSAGFPSSNRAQGGPHRLADRSEVGTAWRRVCPLVGLAHALLRAGRYQGGARKRPNGGGYGMPAMSGT